MHFFKQADPVLRQNNLHGGHIFCSIF